MKKLLKEEFKIRLKVMTLMTLQKRQIQFEDIEFSLLIGLSTFYSPQFNIGVGKRPKLSGCRRILRRCIYSGGQGLQRIRM